MPEIISNNAEFNVPPEHPEEHIPPHMPTFMRPPVLQPPVHPPFPPHARKRMFRIEMTEKDFKILTDVFHDEDTVSAAVGIIHKAPPEIQVLVIQILKMIEETKNEG